MKSNKTTKPTTNSIKAKRQAYMRPNSQFAALLASSQTNGMTRLYMGFESQNKK